MAMFKTSDIIVLAGVGVGALVLWNYFKGKSVTDVIQDTPLYQAGFDAGTRTRDELCSAGYTLFCDTKTTQYENIGVGLDQALLLGSIDTPAGNWINEANFMTSNGCYFRIDGSNVDQRKLYDQCNLFRGLK